MPDKVSLYAVAAMTGCFHWESNVNPGVWESLVVPSDLWDHVYQYDGIGGYGLGQWTNVPSQDGSVSWRARDYAAWAREHGYPPSSGTAQIKYITEVEKTWYDAGRMGFNTLDEFLTTDSHDIDGLTWDFLACWEGVPGDHYEERREWAHKFFDFIREHKDDDKSNYHWIESNAFLSEDDQKNNALMVYWALGGYDPGGDPTKPDEEKKKKAKRSFWLCIGHKQFI